MCVLSQTVSAVPKKQLSTIGTIKARSSGCTMLAKSSSGLRPSSCSRRCASSAPKKAWAHASLAKTRSCPPTTTAAMLTNGALNTSCAYGCIASRAASVGEKRSRGKCVATPALSASASASVRGRASSAKSAPSPSARLSTMRLSRSQPRRR